MKLFDRIVRSFLLHTAIGRKAAKFFWAKKESGDGMRYLYNNKKAVFDGLPIDFDNEEVNAHLKKDTEKWNLQEEYVLELDDVIVEPERCFGIQGRNELIVQTTTVPGQYPFILPYLLNKKNAQVLDKAVIYDGYASKNYYHHLLNAVNSLSVLDKVSLPDCIPFIINRSCFESRYFQFLYNESERFKKLNWLVQEENDWYRVKKAYRLQCVHFDKEPWQRTLKLYNLTPQKGTKKIFLSRDKHLYSRALLNEKEISTLLETYGFETIYAEQMTMGEQVKLFQNTKYLVALHGAGLVQQFFMNYDEANIIEVMPKDLIMPLYYWQAYTLGIHYYDIVVGSKMDTEGNYYLDSNLLERAVQKMLNNQHAGKVYGKTHL